MAKDYEKLSESEKKKEDWMNTKWRPMMGWTYMLTCITDFVIFPILWSIIQALGNGGQVNMQWQPITLQGAGLFHIAMGAILGIAVYGRTKEKLEHVAGPGSNMGSTYTPPPPMPRSTTSHENSQPPRVNQPYYNDRNSFDEPTITIGFGGKRQPADAPQPLI